MATSIDVYARVSRKGDKEQRSTTGQVAACRAVLAERGHKLGQVHVDDGRSAWNPKVTRPGWEALMARLESGKAGGVIVFDLERFARQPDDGSRLIRAAEGGLLIMDSDQEYDVMTASGRKAFRDAMNAAEYYSMRLSDRTRRGKRVKAMSGQVDMRRSFGFEADGVTVRPDEAMVLRDCAARLLAGEPQDSIIKSLNAEGVPAVRGAQWGYTTFRQLMTRPRSAGLISHNGQIVEGVKLPGEPILDRATYDAIVALFAGRRTGRQPSGKYLLTGFAYCHCGTPLKGRPVTGTNRRQYWCPARHAPGRTFITAGPLDDHIADWTIRTLADPEQAEARAAQEAAAAAERAAVENEIARAKQLANQVAERLGRGEMELDRYEAIVKPLDARIAELRIKLDLMAADAAALPPGRRTARDVLSPAAYARGTLLAEWESGTVADRRVMVRRALAGRRIVIEPGKPGPFDPAGRVAVV